MENQSAKRSWMDAHLVDGGSEQNQCCFLCQSAPRKLCQLSTAENLKALIRKYLRIKVLSDANKFVCEDCIEKLKSLKWFVLQGRKNDIFLKNLQSELLPQDENYCRLCLATTDRLQAIFTENTQQHHNNALCELVKECIRIEIDYHRDFTSHICALCRSHLEMFITFKRITQQLQNEKSPNPIKPVSPEVDGKHEAVEASKQNDVVVQCDTTPVLKVVNTDQNGEPVKKKKRYRRTKAEMALARAQGLVKPIAKANTGGKTKKNKKASVPKVPTITESNPWALPNRKKICQTLWTADDERNFEVTRATGGRVRIFMDGFPFYLSKSKADGTSLWHCDSKKLHNCRMDIIVSANGKIATVCEGRRHSHSKELGPLFKCPLGKGKILHADGTEDIFWLIEHKRMGRPVERHLIYRGYRYILISCFQYYNKDTSLWACRTSRCNATLEINGIFEKISSLKGTHAHPEICDKEWREALRDSRVSRFSEDVISSFRSGKACENKKQLPDIYGKLSTVNNFRDFEVIKLKKDIYKIRYDRYDYKLYLKQQDGSTLWKCIWDGIHSCKAVIVVTSDGNSAAYYGIVEHNHPVEPGQILRCEPQQYSVRNIANDAMEGVSLLERECKYFRSRTILYGYHLYNLYQIVNDESSWSCIRTDSNGEPCLASMIVTGRMESFLQKGVHCHQPIPKSDIKSIIKSGNLVDLSALKQTNDSMPADMAEPVMADDVLEILKQQLLSNPTGRGTIWDMTENKNNSFYFVKDQAKKNDMPYKFLYQKYRYAFATIDEYGISQWICCQLLERSTLAGTCTARATIEGVFHRVSIKGFHNHDGIPQSLV